MARSINYTGLKVGGLVPFASALVKGTDENKLVKISASGTVVLCTTEDTNFYGIVRIIDADDGLASVQVDGVAIHGYDTDHAPTVTDGSGWQALQVGKTPFNTVKPATEAVDVPLYRVITVDTVNHLITFILG
jgi:hypothetical protein